MLPPATTVPPGFWAWLSLSRRRTSAQGTGRLNGVDMGVSSAAAVAAVAIAGGAAVAAAVAPAAAAAPTARASAVATAAQQQHYDQPARSACEAGTWVRAAPWCSQQMASPAPASPRARPVRVAQATKVTMTTSQHSTRLMDSQRRPAATQTSHELWCWWFSFPRNTATLGWRPPSSCPTAHCVCTLGQFKHAHLPTRVSHLA